MDNPINLIPNGLITCITSRKPNYLGLLEHAKRETVAITLPGTNLSLCRWQEMFWEELPFQACTDVRINFIKQLADEISQLRPDKK